MNHRPGRKAIIAAAAVLALGGATAAIADRHFDDDHDHDRYGKGYERLLKGLDDHIDLSAEQEAELERIFIERREAALALREERRASLQELITADAVTAEQVAGVFENLRERREGHDLRHEAAEIFAAVHAVLTPEQRAQLAEQIGSRSHGRWFSRGASRHDGWSRLFFDGHGDGRHDGDGRRHHRH